MIKEFTLGATKWTVEEVDRIDDDALGVSHLTESRIEIAKTWKGSDISDGCKQTTLSHEVIHAILDTAGYYELSNNEKFVQMLAVLIEQFDKTKK